MSLKHPINVRLTMQLDVVSGLDHVNAIITSARIDLGSHKLVDLGDQLLRSRTIMRGNCKIINLMTDKDELPIDLTMVEICS